MRERGAEGVPGHNEDTPDLPAPGNLPVLEILADLQATGWTHTWDSMRRDIAKEPRAVREFSDECRFWVARATE